MFAKLCVLIISMGVTSCVLLGLRQERLDAVHATAVAQRSILQQPKDLAKLRACIAAASTPRRIADLAALKLGTLTALNVHGTQLPDDAGRVIVADTKAEREPASRRQPRRRD